MKKAFFLIFISAALIFVAGYVSSVWESYHDFRGRCLDCHLTRPKKGDRNLTLVKDITVMCYWCHSDVKGLTHPVDVRPSMEIPGIFPLDWKGGLTCLTCHTVHKKGRGDAHLRVRAQGQGFCLFCHSDMDKDIHKVGVGTAHMNSTVKTTLFRPGDYTGVTLDELSIQCLSCHDATFAAESLVANVAVEGFHNNLSLGLSHPIGVSYIDAKRKYRGAYTNVRELPPQIKLFNGIVGCGSCHNPYSKGHSQLVMSNIGSALCLACHVK